MQEFTNEEDEDAQMEMGDDSKKQSGISVVLNSLKSQEVYLKVSETDEEGNGMGVGSTRGLDSEMETD